MDRNTVLIIVLALALIGGWALMNFVLWPEPQFDWTFTLDKEPISSEQGGMDEDVIVVNYAHREMALGLTYKSKAIDKIVVTIEGRKEPLAVITGADVEKGDVLINKRLMDALPRAATPGARPKPLVVTLTGTGQGGERVVVRKLGLGVSDGTPAGPVVGPPSVTTRSITDTRPAPTVGQTTDGSPHAPAGAMAMAVGGTPEGPADTSEFLLLGTDENDAKGEDGKPLYPIKVGFSRVGASIHTLKLSQFKDRVPPTFWVGSEAAAKPGSYPLLNPLKPLAKVNIFSSSLTGVKLQQFKAGLSTDFQGNPIYEYVALPGLNMSALGKIGKLSWRVPEKGVTRDKNGVAMQIVFEADVNLRRTVVEMPELVEGEVLPAPVEREESTAILRLTKTYWIRPGGHEVLCRLEVENLTTAAQAEQLGLPSDLYVELEHTGPIGVPGGDHRYSRKLVVAVTKEGKIQRVLDEDMPKALVPPGGTTVHAEVLGFCLPGCGGGEAAFAPFSFPAENKVLGEPSAKKYKVLTLPMSAVGVRWAGVYNKYFAALWVPRNLTGETLEGEDPYAWPLSAVDPEAESWVKKIDGIGFRESPTSKTANWTVRFTTAPLKVVCKDLAGGKNASRKSVVFSLLAVPKSENVLSAYAGANVGIVKETQGACFCMVPGLDQLFGLVLKGLTVVTFGNYGVAIILLVVVIRVLMFPLSRKGQLSMLKMQKLAPKIEELKKKHKDKQELQQATMAMYREHGVSPFGGCLPMFIQIPIWVALWMSLQATIELRHAAFLPFWITDLAGPDALISWSTPVNIPLLSDIFWGGASISSFNLLPLLMAGVMFLQQKWAPKPDAETEQQGQQRKMMKYMMLIFPILLYTAPAGLTLYIMTSTGIGLIETRYLRQHLKDLEARGELFKAKKGKGFMQRMLARAQSLHDVRGSDKGGGGKGGSTGGGRKDWRGGSRGGRKQ